MPGLSNRWQYVIVLDGGVVIKGDKKTCEKYYERYSGFVKRRGATWKCMEMFLMDAQKHETVQRVKSMVH